MVNAVVIGCGWSGQYVLQELGDCSQVNIVAVVEPDEKKGFLYSRKYACRHFLSLKDLLESMVEFDTGFVCTLPSIHFSVCQTLIKLGKNIFCEKPVCRDADQVLFLGELTRQKSCKFGVNYNQRFAPAVQMAKEELLQDTLVHLITGSMYQRGPKKTGGHVEDHFLITDSCCHILDLMCFLNGRVIKAAALINRINSDIVSNITVNLLFENGSIGNMFHTFVGGVLDSQHPFQSVEIHTEKARYVINNLYDSLTLYEHDSLMHKVFSPSVFQPRNYGHSMRASVRAYILSVDKHLPLAVDIEDAIYNARLLRTIIKAIESGKLEEVI